MNENSIPFGAPGIEPRWTSSAKDGLGTAYHSASCIWFTLSHGIINEIYFPHVDLPNTRDLQLLITDGESFCHEERRGLLHQTEYPEQNALFYRLTNSDREGRYRLVKEIVVDPHSSVLLMHARLEVLDPKVRGKLRLYALLAPHMKGTGMNNSAWWCGLDGRKLFDVQREDVDMSFGCTPDFARRYVGFSDVADVVAYLIAALQPNDVVVGGGNVNELKELPPGCRVGDNANAFLPLLSEGKVSPEMRQAVPKAGVAH